ncbi:hypothetical protein SPBR_08121 [Sporothrix brasiliensis 5110]|uniref:Oligopeptide transporter 2 n=1 Tax=Sporothrix brasiliensis 5110 TaxID=1398154 RepID=A0A0C2IN37_9PEZI|nr:uncharacterized protein SPBR_08121 [Sporothrix brasiliensis 5110]KIH86422.1 hypothetical protein SPBR_08121 [Sporothrix brasiliensis 5110]
MTSKGVLEPVPAPPLEIVESHKPGFDEKHDPVTIDDELHPTDTNVEDTLNVTEGDLAEAKALAGQMTLEEVRVLMTGVYKMHENDPNFPHLALRKIHNFINNQYVFDEPEKHADLIYEMKVEAALITNNSPYAEVRAVVSNQDDTTTPVSTIRAWVIGIGFSVLLAFINQLFSIRQPQITVLNNVAQLLSFPIGKLWEKTVPDWGVMLPALLVGRDVAGTPAARLSLNPGPFNKKEHMLITIMASVAYNTPYTDNIIWTQYMPQYFNQAFAGQFSYQILMALSTSLIGYGLAGLARRFLVYPAYCVWPTSLVTIALNEAFHSDDAGPVTTPWRSVWRASRIKFFLITFGLMFVWFWFPNYIFTALSTFSWMTWIAPGNLHLNAWAGGNRGLGLNPVPTFDWNIVTFMYDPLMVPFFSTINSFAGALLGCLVIGAVWYGNGYHTSYLPINSNRLFDNTGRLYNISRIVDDRQIFSQARYEAYSPAYLAAGNLVVYVFFFAIYPATLVYIGLNHRYEFVMGMKNVFAHARHIVRRLYSREARAAYRTQRATGGNGGIVQDDGGNNASSTYQDVHNRLMAAYPEVSELWYMAVLLAAVAFGVAGIAGWQTYTTPGVVFYGIVLCVVFVIPVGIVKAMTGIEVTLNVLAEFIGGSWSGGNALAMNYFKAYGYVTCASALRFSGDLKLAHYLKIPPRYTFSAQLVATVVSCLVCTGVLNFQMNKIPNVCTEAAPNKMTCPGINTFFTAAVLWGTIGPQRVFGPGGQYTAMLVGFPLGALVPVLFWWVQRTLRARDEARDVDARTGQLRASSDGAVAGRKATLVRWARQAHPIAFLAGALNLTPYNMMYTWPTVPVSFVSWIVVRQRFLAFWSRYNYVLSASFSSGVAVAGIVIFFALQYNDMELDWWGNNVVAMGCEAKSCVLKHLAPGEHFGPDVGDFH